MTGGVDFSLSLKMTNSINSKCILNSMDISLTLNMTIWIFCSFHSLKMTKVRRHCEQILQKFAWQSTNLNTNSALWIATNLHTHALQILATTKPLSYFYKLSYFVISCHTERSEVSINSKREFAHLRRVAMRKNLAVFSSKFFHKFHKSLALL